MILANVRWARAELLNPHPVAVIFLDFWQNVGSREAFMYEFWSYFKLFFAMLHFYPLVPCSLVSFKGISSRFGFISENQVNISNITLL